MKILSIEELRKMDPKKLEEELGKVEKELFKIKFAVNSGQSKSSHLIENYKKNIAQIKTILNQPTNEE